MSQLRNCTTFEQSRKLAKFLSFESADMYYSKHNTVNANTLYSSCDTQYFKVWEYIPCWSLSALLSIINNIKGWYPGIDAQVEDNKWQICMFSRETGSDTDLSSIGEELVDVCYEVIIKLHDKNLI